MVYNGMFYPVKTQHLLLDNFKIGDGKSLLQIASTFDVARYLPGLYVNSLEQAYENVFFYQKENGKCDFYIAIRLWIPDNRGTLIGVITATRPRDESNTKILEVAYLIGEKYRGNHYMLEAMNAFSVIAANAKYQQLLFEVNFDNEKSRRIIQTLGAEFIKSNLKEKYNTRIDSYILNLNQM